MGGTPSDYFLDPEGRDYDFGPGVGARFSGALIAGGWNVVTLLYSSGWLWTQSEPSKSKHNVHIAGVEVREHLAPHKTPKHWFAVEEFPLTGSGKIQKYKLREQWEAGDWSEL